MRKHTLEELGFKETSHKEGKSRVFYEPDIGITIYMKQDSRWVGSTPYDEQLIDFWTVNYNIDGIAVPERVHDAVRMKMIELGYWVGDETIDEFRNTYMNHHDATLDYVTKVARESFKEYGNILDVDLATTIRTSNVTKGKPMESRQFRLSLQLYSDDIKMFATIIVREQNHYANITVNDINLMSDKKFSGKLEAFRNMFNDFTLSLGLEKQHRTTY